MKKFGGVLATFTILFSNTQVKGIGKELRSNRRLEVLAYEVGSWMRVKNGATGVCYGVKTACACIQGNKIVILG